MGRAPAHPPATPGTTGTRARCFRTSPEPAPPPPIGYNEWEPTVLSFLTPRSQTPFGNALPETPFRVPEAPVTRTRYRFYENEYPYFLTCTIVGWLAVFTRPEAVQIVFDSWNFLK